MKTFYRSVCAVGIGALFLTDANATEIKVLAAAALPRVLNELVPAYEKASGNKVELVYGLATDLRRRIFEGEPGDVVLLPRAIVEDLQKQEKLSSGSVVDIGSTNVALRFKPVRLSLTSPRWKLSSKL